MTNLEHTLYEMHARLQRSEDNSQFMHVRNQVVMEALSRSLQVRLTPASTTLCYSIASGRLTRYSSIMKCRELYFLLYPTQMHLSIETVSAVNILAETSLTDEKS